MTFVPEVEPLRRIRPPGVVERELETGLRVLVARRTGIPLVELRMRIPIASGRVPGDGARERLLAGGLLAGTSERTAAETAELLQRLGGWVRTASGPDDLVLSGAVLAHNLRPYLDLLAEALTDAQFPEDELDVRRARVAQELRLAARQPGVVAGYGLLARLYGRHPYGLPLPAAEDVDEVTSLTLQRVRGRRVVPDGSVVVLAGDVRAERTLDDVAAALGDWWGVAGTPLKEPSLKPTARTLLLPREGSVQASIRIGAAALGRQHDAYAALRLANTVFGGYFSSRLVENLRERRGYAYSPGSGIEHRRVASHLTIAADVATDVCVPALLEIRYELARTAADRMGADEVEAARRFLIGSMALSVQTAGGLASQLVTLAADGLGPEFLRQHHEQLARASVEDVQEVAAQYLSPKDVATVVVGEPDELERQLRTLDEVERAPTPT